MAKSKRGRGGKRGGGGGGEPARTDAIASTRMSNARFERYYRAQHIVPEDEWPALLEALRAPLPTTFRVAGSRQTAKVLNELIEGTYTTHLEGLEFEGEAVKPPVKLPWYPDGLAWQFNVPKKVLRKQPEFKKFHSFLVYETEVGNISRQEAVSMIPPLLLDVEPHHRVIDMCAAPGSKTAQLLEALHANDSLSSSSTPTGLLIANDSDHKRAHMLIHQSARLPSPALLVTNLDASIFPSIAIPAELAAEGDADRAAALAEKREAGGKLTKSEKKRRGALLFDRVLCDVPCSGDGTIRKNPGIWIKWSTGDGNGLHSLQLRILQRAMRMLRFGGRIVYSTCSLNPVENEAVVAAALRSMPGFSLVDASDRLSGLVRRPGLTTWRPAVDKDGNTPYSTFAEYKENVGEGGRLVEEMWPPAEEEAERLGLTRCMRVYPHLQDTGGFFIAVLEKAKAPVSSTAPKRQAEDLADEAVESESKKPRLDEAEADAINVEEPVEVVPEPETPQTTEAPTAPAPAKGKDKAPLAEAGGEFKEHPYTFLSPDDPSVVTCMSQLDLDASFPTSNLFVRNPTGETVRSLYLTNDLARGVVQCNDYTRIRLLTAGTKLFVKQGSDSSPDARFRILAEGLPVAMPYVKREGVIEGNLAALRTLMEGYYPLCVIFAEGFRKQIEAKPTGSHVVRFAPEHWDGATIAHEFHLPLWKSNVSVCLMIDKKTKSALSLRLFGEDVSAVAREAQEQKAKNKASTTAVATTEAGEDGTDVPVAASEGGELTEVVNEEDENMDAV